MGHMREESRAVIVVSEAANYKFVNLRHLMLDKVPAWVFMFRDLKVVDIRY